MNFTMTVPMANALIAMLNDKKSFTDGEYQLHARVTAFLEERNAHALAQPDRPVALAYALGDASVEAVHHSMLPTVALAFTKSELDTFVEWHDIMQEVETVTTARDKPLLARVKQAIATLVPRLHLIIDEVNTRSVPKAVNMRAMRKRMRD